MNFATMLFMSRFPRGHSEKESVSAKLDSQRLRRRAEVETRVGFVAVPDADETWRALRAAGDLFDSQEVALSAGCRAEIDAAEDAGHPELVRSDLSDQGPPDGRGIPAGRGAAAARAWPESDDRPPVAKIHRLRRLALLLEDGLKFALEVQTGDFAHDRLDRLVSQPDVGHRLLGRARRAQRLVGIGRIVESKGRPANGPVGQRGE